MYQIMLVDDEPWVLARLRTIIPWEEYGFAIAYESQEPELAFRQMRVIRPDVVITDINMPGLSGLSLIEAARDRAYNAEYIIISGYDDFSFAQKAIKNGVFHYFIKPVDEDELIEVLKKLRVRLDGKVPGRTPVPALQDGIPATGNHCLNSILLYLHESYSQPLTLAELSKKFYVSQTYICDLFSKYLDTTFVQYLNDLRLTSACRQLAESNLPVSRVALETGFRDYSYFSRVFKKRYGISPSHYRRGGGK